MVGRISSAHPHRLMVEGKDFHAIIALTRRHGLAWDGTHTAVPYAESADGKENLLPALPVALKAHHRLGVVLDADLEGESPAHQSWSGVRSMLLNAPDMAPGGIPAELPMEGLVVRRPSGRRFGLWVMPNNQQPGKLEDFVATLIPRGDGCWPHAKAACAEASNRGAPFAEKDRIKAELHTWLAWRSNPGVPFGTAIHAHFLDHDSPTALAFLSWFQAVFIDD